MSSDKLNFYLFADDTNLLYADKSLKSLESVVNSELIKVYNWLTANKLTLNVKKSNCIIFRPYQKRIDYPIDIKIYDHNTKSFISLELKDYVKYLGIIIDANLTWKPHIDYMALKISKTIGIISRLRHFVPTNTLLNIYRSLVFPYLQFGIALWGQAANIHMDKLLKLQKRVLRLIYFTDYKAHAVPLFIHSNNLPVNMIFIKSIMDIMHDYLFTFTSEIHTYNTKSISSEMYHVKYSRTNQRRCSFTRIGVKVWNCIPLKIRKLSKNKFKKEIKSTLRDIFCEEDSCLDTPSIIKKLNKQKK